MLGTVTEFASTALERPYVALAVLQTAGLLAATALLLYPVYAYAENVAYAEGLVALAVGLTLLTVANLLSFVPEPTVRNAVPGVSLHPVVWMTAINLLAGISGTVGVYFFAREFLPGGAPATAGPTVQTPDEDPESVPGDFEAADDGDVEDDDAR